MKRRLKNKNAYLKGGLFKGAPNFCGKCYLKQRQVYSFYCIDSEIDSMPTTFMRTSDSDNWMDGFLGGNYITCLF